MIELVIVVVIIGIIAAIAIPRLSRGSAGAADSAVSANLAVLRKAIELYQAEHGTLPSATSIAAQLTEYTDDSGATSATKTGAYIYGPYVRSIPPLPVGAKKGKTGIAAADGATVGWIYDESTGKISANTGTTEVDARGIKYSDY
jgi:type II secretory pathway pseudopilin PulG